jgi:hypothetical protein
LTWNFTVVLRRAGETVPQGIQEDLRSGVASDVTR